MKLKMDKHVVFHNEFVSVHELFKYLHSTDIYITPYLNEAQISSGTLSYAVGIGTPSISTPYWHASELLAEGRGRLFNFNNSKQLASLIIDLFNNPAELSILKNNSYTYGRKIVWPKIGEKYMKLADNVTKGHQDKQNNKKRNLDLFLLPPFSLAYINRLTDNTGILQHAKFSTPNLKEGYCLDDNARALLMVLMRCNILKDKRALQLSSIYLNYVHCMQNADGSFRNFLSYKRDFLDEIGSEDSFGRTIWALGYLLANAPNEILFLSGKTVFLNASANFNKLVSLRGIANTMIGISHYLKSNPTDSLMVENLRGLAKKLIIQYQENETSNWKWFESKLSYDNGILPLALLHASQILKDHETIKTAFDSMNFLTETTLTDNHLSIIGNEKWYSKEGVRSVFAQQPIDAMAMVLMFYQAFLVSKNKEYLNKLYTSFLWFLGKNDLGLTLYDFETKGCCDGIESDGINQNQGAESSLAYLISHLTVLQAREKINKNEYL